MFLSEVKNFIKDNKSGKRSCFAWEAESLDAYLSWSFSRDYLFCVLNENGISGIGVAYPLPSKFDGTIDSLLPYDEIASSEAKNDLVVMDWIAVNQEARKNLVQKFMHRFPNWRNQDKWGVHYGKPKLLSNNYITKLSTYTNGN